MRRRTMIAGAALVGAAPFVARGGEGGGRVDRGAVSRKP